MAEYLVKAIDNTNPDADKDRWGCYKRGDIVHTLPQEHGGDVVTNPINPTFVIIKVSESFAVADQYARGWERHVAYNVVNSDLPQDSHRIDIYMDPSHTGSSNENLLTRVEVENFIEHWGGSVVKTNANGCRFDIKIYDAIVSMPFWQRNISSVIFTEIAYQQSTGGHRVQADLSSIPPNKLNPSEIQALIESRGGAVFSYNIQTKTVVFDITRADVKQRFQEDINNRIRKVYIRRRYRVPESIMLLAEANDRYYDMGSIAALIDKQA